ncbi:MAG: GGDEF domain-containing protein [Nitrospirae bacterium]|nr:GGDEF domain-containing protein [Nitrospirota bacterium]
MKNQKEVAETGQVSRVCREKCQLQSLAEMINLDDLTRVMNRKTILASLENEIRRVFRHKYPLSLLLIDLDYFKKVNDTFGHLNGDIVLKESVQKMKLSLRREDYLGRYGGDEFIAILPHTEMEGAMIVANRLVSDFQESSISLEKGAMTQTVSIGVAIYSSGDTTKTLLERADRSLYQAKGEGRSRSKGPMSGTSKS